MRLPLAQGLECPGTHVQLPLHLLECIKPAGKERFRIQPLMLDAFPTLEICTIGSGLSRFPHGLHVRFPVNIKSHESGVCETAHLPSCCKYDFPLFAMLVAQTMSRPVLLRLLPQPPELHPNHHFCVC